MPYSKDIAQARITRLNRKNHISQAQFLQCMSVSVSRSEALLMILGFLDKINPNPQLAHAIQELRDCYVDLDYERAMDVLKSIFNHPPPCIEEHDQETWEKSIQCIRSYLKEGKAHRRVMHESAQSSRRMFESLLSANYLESRDTLDAMSNAWPGENLNDVESLVDFVLDVLFDNTSIAEDYWTVHSERILKQHDRAREKCKLKNDRPQVRSPGILKSTTPRPRYMYDREISFHGKSSQSDKTRAKISDAKNWVTENPESPFVASYSGHAIWYVGFLIHLCAQKPQEEKIEFAKTMLKALLAVYMSQGYHSYQEMITIVKDPEILGSLREVGIDLNPCSLFSDTPHLYHSVFSETIDYNTTLLLKRSLHHELGEQYKQRVQVILENFRQKIETIGTHHKPAHQVALSLYQRLQILKEDAFHPPMSSDKLSNFVHNVRIIIEEAAPVLEQDLGWNNHVKQMFNTITKAIIPGNPHGFFVAKSSAKAAVEALNEDLASATKQYEHY